ncbi:MAG: DNA translocase FtsK 4TM domain-containing protein [Acidimicrobiia bacterium]
MATEQRVRPGNSGRRPAKRTSSKRAAPAVAPAPSARARANRQPAWRTAIAGHESDLAGLALIVVALVAGLGIYVDLGGPVGRMLSDLIGGAVGIGRYLVPAAFVGAGLALVRDPEVDQRKRLAVSGTVVAIALCGLAHIARGPNVWPGLTDQWRRGGGIVGALVGQPLQNLLSPWGAALVLVAITVAGALVLTQTSLANLARATASGVRPGVSALTHWFGSLATLTSDRLNGAGPGSADDDRDGDSHPTVDLRAPARSGHGESAELYDVMAMDPDELDKPGSFGPPGARDDAEPGETETAKASRKRARLTPAEKTEQLSIDLPPGAEASAWKLPPLSMLEKSGAQEIDRKQVEELGHVLEASLASHGVETRLIGMTVGPTVTRYELELAPGVKVARVTSLNKDIAYAMASADVRILAPIPGRSAIGVEVPNRQRHLVSLGDILSSQEAQRATHPLEVAIGRDIAGRSLLMNLATTPHLLIAGATGAGKSSALNSLVTSILMRTTPEQVRLILIDPKRVEMGQYNRLPHLLTQVVTSPKKAANALQWAVKEMERRYDLLHEVGTRDIGGYNAAFDRGDLQPDPGSDKVYERLPYIVVIVDELNDLMMVAARDVEDSICRIAQMARAVGIHLVIATQRPSVNVITGVIKANVPARMAFAVSSATDSRVILDQVGAERLVGKGDMLLIGPSSGVAQRIQGAWVGEDEVRKIAAFWRRQSPEPTYVSGVEGEDTNDGFGSVGSYASGDDADDEALVRSAMELVVRSQLGSTSMLQRKLKVGFARAGRIMDLLEQRGVVGPSEGSKARAVLMSVEELELMQNAGRE